MTYLELARKALADRDKPMDALVPSLESPAKARGFRYITNPSELVQVVDSHLSQAVLLGLDLETYGGGDGAQEAYKAQKDAALDPLSGNIRLITLGTDEGDVFVVDCHACASWKDALAPVLGDPDITKVAHNAKFDLKFLLAQGLTVNGVFDTMLAAQVLDSGQNLRQKGYFTLAAVAERHLGERLDKAQQTSDWGAQNLSQAQLEYAARDVAILLPLSRRLRLLLRAARLDNVAQLEMSALPAVAWLELSGAPFASEAWAGVSDIAVAEKLALEDEVRLVLGVANINLDSPRQVQKALAGLGIDVSSTDQHALLAVAGRHEVIRQFMAYREASKRANTYGIEYLKHLHPVTGRIHADWHQLGAASGRMSCSNPNLQNIPRASAYRACISPAPGRVLVKADYNQIELRIAAQMAGDKRMIEAYRSGEDLHSLTASAVLNRGDSVVSPQARQAAKALNFGLIYGMGARRLREYAANDYGVDMTEEDAERFRERFFSTYPNLRRWHRKQADGLIATRTVGGRRRVAVERFPEKLNTPVQGTGADGLKAAMALLWETRDQCPSATPVLCVHDEIVVECDADEAERAREWLVECMTKGMERFVVDVPVVVEAKVMNNWGNTQ